MPTVQDTLISALRSAGYSRNPVPSGRTDAGVHARMQVLSMRVVEDEGEDASLLAQRVNALLPPTLGVALARKAHPRFHAAWSSSGKVYRYVLASGPHGWAVDADPRSLQAVLSLFVGTRDFGAFHDRTSKRKPRTVARVDVEPQEGGAVIWVRGGGFGRFMVRLMVGAAVAVVRGEAREVELRRALEDPASQRFQAFRAPAQALTLHEVLYPPEVDPFSAEERQAASGVPARPPFLR